MAELSDLFGWRGAPPPAIARSTAVSRLVPDLLTAGEGCRFAQAHSQPIKLKQISGRHPGPSDIGWEDILAHLTLNEPPNDLTERHQCDPIETGFGRNVVKLSKPIDHGTVVELSSSAE